MDGIYNITYKDQPKYKQVDLQTALDNQHKENFKCFQFKHVRKNVNKLYTLTRMIKFVNNNPVHTHWQ